MFPSCFIVLNIIYMMMSSKFVLQGKISPWKFTLLGTMTYMKYPLESPILISGLTHTSKNKQTHLHLVFFPISVNSNSNDSKHTTPKSWVILYLLLLTQSTFNLVGFTFKIFPSIWTLLTNPSSDTIISCWYWCSSLPINLPASLLFISKHSNQGDPVKI